LRGIHLLLELLLVTLMILFLAELKEKTLEKLLKEEGIQFSFFGLTSLDCLRVEGLEYRGLPIAREIELCIFYPDLLNQKLTVSRLKARELDLNSIEKIVKEGKRESPSDKAFSLPLEPSIKRAQITALYRYRGINRGTLLASDLTLKRGNIDLLMVEGFAAKIRSKGWYDGKLHLQGVIYPKPSYLAEIAPQINPHSIKQILVTTDIGRSGLTYRLQTGGREVYRGAHITLHSQGRYNFSSGALHSENEGKIEIAESTIESRFNLDYLQKKLSFQGEASIENGPYPIPIKPSFYRRIDLTFSGTPDRISLELRNSWSQISAQVEGFRRVTFSTSPIPLKALLISPPPKLANTSITLKGEYSDRLELQLTSNLGSGEIIFVPPRLKGSFALKDFEGIRLSALNPIEFQADLDRGRISLHSKLLRGEFSSKPLRGEVTIGKSKIHLKRGDGDLEFRGTIPSLKELVTTLSRLYPIDIGGIDAHLLLAGTYDPEKERYRFQISSPWSPGRREGSPITFLDLRAHGDRENLYIDYYALALANHAFYSTKTSHISFKDGTISLDPLWIEDRIEVRGRYSKERGRFLLKARNYNYSSIEGSATFDATVKILLKGKRVEAEGGILLKGGTITMPPRKRKSISDPDIIVVDLPQKEEEGSHFFRENIALNIKIDSQTPLIYRIPDLEVHLKPDLLLWKEYQKELQLLGYIHILRGSYSPLGEHYRILASDLYFYGKPTDPLLDLHIKTKKESYTIYITVSGTLTNPIIRFDSDPYLPQKDILTLLLMGSKSSSLLFKATGGDRLVGALGNLFLKNMLSSIGIKLDTLTLTSDGGRLGFEIGKRIGKNILVIYKNDAVSTIIIRYEMSDHLESEIIFGPQKSGINFYYRNHR